MNIHALNRPGHYRVDGRVVILAEGSYDPDDSASIRAALQAAIDEADNPPPPPLSDLKRQVMEAAQAEQARRLGLGIRAAVGPFDVVLSSDAASRERILAIAAALANGKLYPAAGVRLFRRDGEEITAQTALHFRAVVLALENRLEALAQHYGTLINAIRTAASGEALAQVDVTRGWPGV